MTTARRTREIGIRLALGSSRERIIMLLVREQLPSVITGLAAGAAASAWGVQLVQVSLYHVPGDEPQVWTVAVTSILLTAMLGALLPALRASRTDPMKALRVD